MLIVPKENIKFIYLLKNRSHLNLEHSLLADGVTEEMLIAIISGFVITIVLLIGAFLETILSKASCS